MFKRTLNIRNHPDLKLTNLKMLKTTKYLTIQ